MDNQSLVPFVKWPGGKSNEIPIIKKNLPKQVDRYFEPFLGGGSVFLSLEYTDSYINDFSRELMFLYEMIGEKNKSFFMFLEEFSKTWKILDKIVMGERVFLEDLYRKYRSDLAKNSTKDIQKKYKNIVYTFVISNGDKFNGLLKDHFNYDIGNFLKQINLSLINKMNRMNTLEKQKGILPEEDVITNILTAFKSAYYTHFRYIYNHQSQFNIKKPFSSALFFFIREHCYSSMFRYNSQGHFNVPYGGMTYNKKNFDKKIKYMKQTSLVKKITNSTISSLDFEDFLNKYTLNERDFIFLDPPYDTDFSTYAQNVFDKKDQIRLANLMLKTKAKFLMIIKNTDFIYNLYNVEGIKIKSFDKKYLVSFKDRNDRDVEHLVISNY